MSAVAEWAGDRCSSVVWRDQDRGSFAAKMATCEFDAPLAEGAAAAPLLC